MSVKESQIALDHKTGALEAVELTLELLKIGIFPGLHSEILSRVKTFHSSLHQSLTQEIDKKKKELQLELDELVKPKEEGVPSAASGS